MEKLLQLELKIDLFSGLVLWWIFETMNSSSLIAVSLMLTKTQ